MSITPEQFAAANQASIESLMTLAKTALGSVEKLSALNLNTARAALEDAVANTKTLMGAKDLQEVVSLQSAMAQPGVEKAVAYGKSVGEISAQAQDEVAKLAEAQFVELNKSFGSFLDGLAKQAPAGSEPAVTALKTAVAAANSAYDSVSKVAKQVAEAAQANLSAATDAATKAVTNAAAAAPGAAKKK